MTEEEIRELKYQDQELRGELHAAIERELELMRQLEEVRRTAHELMERAEEEHHRAEELDSMGSSLRDRLERAEAARDEAREQIDNVWKPGIVEGERLCKEAERERDEVTARTLHLAHGLKKTGGKVHVQVAELLENFCSHPTAGEPVIKIVEAHRDKLQETLISWKKWMLGLAERMEKAGESRLANSRDDPRSSSEYRYAEELRTLVALADCP